MATTVMTGTEALSRLAAAAIPREALDDAAQRLADCLGLCILTADWPEIRQVRDHVRAMSGVSQATFVGGGRAPASLAAMVNGMAAHAAGLDDFHAPTAVHPMVTVVPAALAAAQMAGVSGTKLLEAVVVGYDVACRLGRAAPRGVIHARGFHPTSSIGTVAAAAAASAALDMPQDRTAHALAVAAGRCAGLFHFADKAWTKPLQAGWAASAGVDAALLARQGFVGPLSILEGPRGLLQALAGEGAFDPAPLFEPAGDWAIREVSFKPYAHSTELHTAIDALLDALTGTGCRGTDVAEVEVALRPAVFRATAEPVEAKRRPTTVRDAQQSVYFAAAVAIHAAPFGGGVDTFHRWFRADSLEHPGILNLAERVVARADASLRGAGDESSPAQVVVVTRDGRRVDRELKEHRGSPGQPFTWEDLEARFAHLTGGRRGGLNAIRTLAAAESIESVAAMLQGSRSEEEGTRD